VGVGVAKVGTSAAPVIEVPETDPEPWGKLVLFVKIVNVEVVPGARFETVTKPVPLIDTVPEAVAEPVQEKLES
jgi:hypothetical protein